MQKLLNLGWSGMAAGALMVALSGCAGTSMTWPTTQPHVPVMTSSNAHIPTAQDCINIKQATPSQFVCHGKVYTAQQLQKIREDAAKGTSASS